MGLNSEITEAVRDALANDLLDARTTLSFVVTKTPAYNPGTGAVTASEKAYKVTGVVSPVADTRIDGEVIRVGDISVLILADDLSVNPKPDDEIEIDHERWRVNVVNTDPAKVAWEIVARRV